MLLNPEKTLDLIDKGLQEYMESCGAKRLTVAISGGVDSALAAAIAVNRVGAENVNAIYIGIESSDTSLRRARMVAEAFGINLAVVDMTGEFESTSSKVRLGGSYSNEQVDAMVAGDKTILGGLKSCMRAPIIRFYNRFGNLRGDGKVEAGLIFGTDQRCEGHVFHFWQKGGDGDVDVNPFSQLSKGEVMQLAMHMGVPMEIVMAIPSPDLHGIGDQHSDGDELTALSGGVKWTHTAIAEDGTLELGTIEMISKWVDKMAAAYRMTDIEFMESFSLADVADRMRQHEVSLDRFGLSYDHGVSAIRWYHTTKHKVNPAIWGGPTRAELLEAGALAKEPWQ